MKAIKTIIFVPDEDEEIQSQLDYDTAVLSAAVKYMCKYYEDIFSGLDAVIKACNESIENKKEQKS